MNDLKYITFTGDELNYGGKPPARKEMAIVFCYEVTHKNMAHGLFRSMNLQTFEDDLLGAGFCRWTGTRFVCEGHSETLNLKSRGELDAIILNRILGVEK